MFLITSAKKEIKKQSRKLTKKVHINFYEKAVSEKNALRQKMFHQVRLKKVLYMTFAVVTRVPFIHESHIFFYYYTLL